MTQSPESSPRWSIAEAVLSFAGAGVAGTLWWAHRVHVDLPCTANGGCAQVAASAEAFVNIGPWHDVSVALLGFVGYLVLLTLSMMKLGSETPKAMRILHWLLWAISAGGFVYSWYLQYVAHFVIQAFCVYCFTSACLMTALFVTASCEWASARRSRPPA